MRAGSLHILGMCCALYVAVVAAFVPKDFAIVLWQHVIVFAISLPIIAAVTIGVAAFLENPAAPLSGARKIFRTFQLGAAAKIVLVFLLGVVAYNTFKFNIPRLIPFYADPFFANLDDLLHGQQPWRLLHKLPRGLTSGIVDFFYSVVWFGQWFGILLYVALWNGGARKERYLWALALTTLVVGTVMATALSSVGPIFYDRFYGGYRFDHLADTLEADGPLSVKRFAAYLIETYDGRAASFGSGISAMPSMHIAIATLNALFLAGFQRSLAIAGWAFLAIMQFGSVYTGWHYAVDGYVSMLVVGLIWWLTGRYFLSAEPLVRPVKVRARTAVRMAVRKQTRRPEGSAT